MKTIILNPRLLANSYKATIANPLTWITNMEDPQQQGILDYLNPILKELEVTPIPVYCVLESILTFESSDSYSGHHIWEFQIYNPNKIEDDDPLKSFLIESFEKLFPNDPEASLIPTQINYIGSHFVITVPYTC